MFKKTKFKTLSQVVWSESNFCNYQELASTAKIYGTKKMQISVVYSPAKCTYFISCQFTTLWFSALISSPGCCCWIQLMVVFTSNMTGFWQIPSRRFCVFNLQTYYLHLHSYSTCYKVLCHGWTMGAPSYHGFLYVKFV